MSAGRTISKDELNSTWGGLATTMHAVVANIQHAKAVLDGFSAQSLVDQFGFTLADANVLKSAATDLGDLATVFTGGTSAYLSGTHDYRVFAKQLLGTGLY